MRQEWYLARMLFPLKTTPILILFFLACASYAATTKHSQCASAVMSVREIVALATNTEDSVKRIEASDAASRRAGFFIPSLERANMPDAALRLKAVKEHFEKLKAPLTISGKNLAVVLTDKKAIQAFLQMHEQGAQSIDASVTALTGWPAQYMYALGGVGVAVGGLSAMRITESISAGDPIRFSKVLAVTVGLGLIEPVIRDFFAKDRSYEKKMHQMLSAIDDSQPNTIIHYGVDGEAQREPDCVTSCADPDMKGAAAAIASDRQNFVQRVVNNYRGRGSAFSKREKISLDMLLYTERLKGQPTPILIVWVRNEAV